MEQSRSWRVFLSVAWDSQVVKKTASSPFTWSRRPITMLTITRHWFPSLSSPLPHILLYEDVSLYYSLILSQVFQMNFSLYVFWLKFCVHFSSLSCPALILLHVFPSCCYFLSPKPLKARSIFKNLTILRLFLSHSLLNTWVSWFCLQMSHFFHIPRRP